MKKKTDPPRKSRLLARVPAEELYQVQGGGSSETHTYCGSSGNAGICDQVCDQD